MHAGRGPAGEPIAGGSGQDPDRVDVSGSQADDLHEGDAPTDGGPDPETEHRHHFPHAHIPHPHLIDPGEDRWKWRARIRRDPRKLFFYRIGVGVAGLLLMVAAIITGPLPGPGGIPLFLLGLAVWSSEFEWAQNLMLRFKALFDRYRGWSKARRVTFWCIFFLAIWSMGYVTMIVSGVPPWLPQIAKDWLGILPGLA